MNNYTNYFGFNREPFQRDIPVKDLYPLPGMKNVYDRFQFTIQCGAVGVVTGDVGAGKSTSLRYACSQLHPSKFQIVSITGNNGTFLELLRNVIIGLNLDVSSQSPSLLAKHIQNTIIDINRKKKIPVLVIDEAHLMRIEVFAQLHTLTQFEFDSKPIMPVILCGQNNLIDCLSYHTSRPLASRVIGRSHLQSLSLQQMQHYLVHHLSIAGIKNNLFTEEAMLAIHQGSGGFLRKANHLAKGSLLAAANDKLEIVSPEHVQLAASEIFA